MAGYHLDYFEIPSSDAEKSSGFFEKAFGWQGVDFGGTYAEIRGAGLLFGVNADPADQPKAPMGVIRADDLNAARAAILAAGGMITREIYAYPGGERFLFNEPGGAEFAVYKPAG